MSSSIRRRFLACALAGVMFAGSTSSAFAADRKDDPRAQKSAVDFTLASNELFVPGVTAPVLAVEPPPAQGLLTAPRSQSSFAGPALRRSLIVSFSALQLLDAHSTTKALQSGGREANPAMAGIASNRTVLFAVKAGTAAATAYLAERLSKNHPKKAIVLMAVLNGTYAAIVAHNYRVARAGR
jgi:hypothetical protein